MMRSGLVAGLALAVAPLAQAQDCSQLNRVVAAAERNFVAISGEEIDLDIYDSLVTFDGAEECGIDDFDGALFYCMWPASPVAESDRQVLKLYDMAKVCLSEGWDWTDLAGTQGSLGAPILEGYRMIKRSGAHRGALVQVYMDAVPGTQNRQVWLEAWQE